MPTHPKPPVRILLHVDDSDHWHRPARLIGDYARTTGAHVTITSSLLLPGTRARALTRANEILALPKTQIDHHERPGIIEYTLPDIARETHADVLVIGRLGSADRLTSGLIGHLVAKRTPSSVLLTRGRTERLRRILVCTEGSTHGHHTFRHAKALAHAFHARLDILHVVSQMGLTDQGQESIDAAMRDFLHSDNPEAAHLRELKNALQQSRLDGEILVRKGLVVEEIVDAVREGGHDLLVIGAHDTTAPGAHLFEDLGGLILRASPVSTLLVRDKTPPTQ